MRPETLGLGPAPLSAASPGRARTLAGVVALATVVLVAGSVLAAVTIHSASLAGSGVGDRGLPLTWWTQALTGSSTIPSPVPSLASTNVSAPTLLGAASTSYGLDAQTAGQYALLWEFVEHTASPVSTEVEIVFEETVAGVTASFEVYLETQASATNAPLDFSFYADVGTNAVVLSSWLEISQQCSAVGACP
jgi:hypothetical protein